MSELAPMLSSPPKEKGFYIPSLDGIRAVSFMLVFVAHSGWDKIIPGGLGVTIFFFLSGYLITTLLRTEAAQTGRISIRDFYIRRVLRIFPPFYVTILLGCILTWTHILPGDIGKGTLFQMGHLANYWTIWRKAHDLHLDGIPLGSNVMWSLAVEEHFYFVFPMLYILLRRYFNVRGQTVFLVLICLGILAWRYAIVRHMVNHHAGYDIDGEPLFADRIFFATDTRADSILWGCIFAIACNPMLDQRRLLGYRLLAVCVLAAGVMIFTLKYRDHVFRETVRYTLHGLILFPFFTAAIIYHQSPIFRWLNAKPIRHLGVLSYSLYLVHFTVIETVKVTAIDWNLVPLVDDATKWPHKTRLVLAVVSFVLSFGVSSAYYRWIEKPCAKLRKRFSHAGGGKKAHIAPVLTGVAPAPVASM